MMRVVLELNLFSETLFHFSLNQDIT